MNFNPFNDRKKCFYDPMGRIENEMPFDSSRCGAVPLLYIPH